jgi:anthranilate phosphoribosyltransferase
MGVYRPELVRMVAEAAAQLDYEHAIIAHGSDGLDEVSILGPTSMADVQRDKIEFFEITPEDFGFKRATFEQIQGGDPEFNARVIRGIFEGGDKGPRRDFLVLNNGFTLYVAGVADSPEQGIEMAQENIDSGAASRKLEEFAHSSHAIAQTHG